MLYGWFDWITVSILWKSDPKYESKKIRKSTCRSAYKWTGIDSWSYVKWQYQMIMILKPGTQRPQPLFLSGTSRPSLPCLRLTYHNVIYLISWNVFTRYRNWLNFEQLFHSLLFKWLEPFPLGPTLLLYFLWASRGWTYPNAYIIYSTLLRFVLPT